MASDCRVNGQNVNIAHKYRLGKHVVSEIDTRNMRQTHDIQRVSKAVSVSVRNEFLCRKDWCTTPSALGRARSGGQCALAACALGRLRRAPRARPEKIKKRGGECKGEGANA